MGPDAPPLCHARSFYALRFSPRQFLSGPPGQCRRRFGPVPLDPHQAVPSVVRYGLAQFPLCIQGVHGQQLQAWIALEQLGRLVPQHPGSVPFLRRRSPGQAQLQVGGPARSPSPRDCPGHPRIAWPACRPPGPASLGPPPPGPPTRSGRPATPHRRLQPGCGRWRRRGEDGPARRLETPSAPASATWRRGRCGPWWSGRRPSPAGSAGEWPGRDDGLPWPSWDPPPAPDTGTEIPPPPYPHPQIPLPLHTTQDDFAIVLTYGRLRM